MNIVNKYIATKEIMIIRDPKPRRPSPSMSRPRRRMQLYLQTKKLVELAKYAEILEKHYGIPQDIEWGVEKNKIFILQSRPITTINSDKKTSDSARVAARLS